MIIKEEGFTLIELLLSVSISLLVLGFSLSGYRTFTDRRQVDLAAEELKSQLTLIKSKAVNGERSKACQNLRKYQITLLSGNKLQYQEICDSGGAGSTTLENNQLVLLDSISIDDSNDNVFSFEALRGNLLDVSNNGIVFTLKANSVCRQVTILVSGDINISFTACL